MDKEIYDVLSDTLVHFENLIDVAYQCDGWESFPSEPLEEGLRAISDARAYMELKRLASLTSE